MQCFSLPVRLVSLAACYLPHGVTMKRQIPKRLAILIFVSLLELNASTAMHEGDIEAVTVEEEGVMDQAMRYYERAVEAVQEAVEDFDREEATEEVKRLYEQARDAGEKVPEDVYSWVREDYGRMFAWEYTVLELGHEELSEAAEKMNLLGAERWECIAVVAGEGGLALFFKRRLKSYLRQVPLRDLLQLLPGDGQ